MRKKNFVMRPTDHIRFGLHADAFDSPPFQQTPQNRMNSFVEGLKALEGLAGKENIARFLRLHYFSESFDLIPILSAHGIDTLLLTDKSIVSHTLSESSRIELEKNGCCQLDTFTLRRSSIRVETMYQEKWSDKKISDYISEKLERHGHFELFTHEVELVNVSIRALLERCLDRLTGMGACPI